jgi:hypothetical protein
MKRPTIKQTEAAIALLERDGRASYCETAQAQMSRGDCVGMAVAHRMDVKDCIDASMTMLEDWNCHLSCAAIEALCKGKQGSYKRKGRKLTITLPEHWAKM